MGDVRGSYDAIAAEYDAAIGGELTGKPLDRGLLDALAELCRAGRLADVGCGPGHVTRYLAERHPDVLGVDLSPAMIDIARGHAPELAFEVASMLALPVPDGAWEGIAAFYSVIHFDAADRARAFAEFARVLRPGGRLLLAFHVDSAEHAAGDHDHVDEWFGKAVDLDGYYLDPDVVLADLGAFEIEAVMRREPIPAAEYPSRRCYLLARRR